MAQLRGEQEPLVRPNGARQRVDEHVVLVAQAAPGKLGQRLGISQRPR